MRDPGRHAWTFPQAAAEASDLLPPAPFDALSDPSVEDLLPAGLALWPRGAAWGTPDGQAAATDTVLAGFTRALLLPFADLYRRAYGLTQESRALTLADSLADWEADFGLPDECVAPGASGAARRRALLSRVRALATITPQDFVQLAAQEGFEIAIEEPSTFECGFSECGGAHSAGGRLEQVYWIVHVYSLAVDYFTCGISECAADRLFTVEDAERLQCLFRRLAPGWSQPVYVIHETTGADALMAGYDAGVALDFIDGSHALRVADEPDLTASGPLATLPGFTFTRASAATRINAAGEMETVGAGVLRFDYDPVTLALLGVLIEPARTNLAVHACAIGTAPWGATAIGGVAAPTVTLNDAPAPDTSNTGTRVVMPAVPAGAANGSRVGISIVGLNAGSYTFSVWLKGTGGGEAVYISATTNAVNYVRHLCVLTTVWQRFEITVSIPSNGATYFFQIGTDLRDSAQAATAAQTFYAWGAQLEAGLQATSLIMTGATTATRAADVLTIPTSALPFNSSEGTLYVECSRDAGPSTESACPISLFGPGRIETSQNSAQNVYGYSGGWTLGGPTLARGTIIRAAQAWSPAGAAMSVNGAAPSTGAVSSIPSVSQLRIGTSGAGFSWEGHIHRAAYLPRRLANTELQAITS